MVNVKILKINLINDFVWGWGNNELEFYTKGRTENARVENGNLVINARVESRGGRQFTWARLFSRKTWTYGKFEARIKAPAGKHLWPEFWMFPNSSVYGIWAASGEIDIMEIRGQKLNVN